MYTYCETAINRQAVRNVGDPMRPARRPPIRKRFCRKVWHYGYEKKERPSIPTWIVRPAALELFSRQPSVDMGGQPGMARNPSGQGKVCNAFVAGSIPARASNLKQIMRGFVLLATAQRAASPLVFPPVGEKCSLTPNGRLSEGLTLSAGHLSGAVRVKRKASLEYDQAVALGFEREGDAARGESNRSPHKRHFPAARRESTGTFQDQGLRTISGLAGIAAAWREGDAAQLELFRRGAINPLLSA